jgi:enamine deaminase RidA (YjgF/YER057c/UK114 family)
VVDGWIFVSGTVAPGPDVPETAAAQCASALRVIETALAEAGAGFADVVRVTYMLPDATEFEACWPVLRTAFEAHPPVVTMIECGLIDPKYRIEIEVTARLRRDAGAGPDVAPAA